MENSFVIPGCVHNLSLKGLKAKMLLNKLCLLNCELQLSSRFKLANSIYVRANLCTEASKPEEKHLVIKCKRKRLNHYADQTYHKFKEVPLATKGWRHIKSKGDKFTVYPNLQSIQTAPNIPLSEIALDEYLKRGLQMLNITELTAFQYEALQVIGRGDHSLLAAETGCGKTLSYLLPLFEQLINTASQEFNTPRAIIIAPNRELVTQIGSVAMTLAKSVDLRVKVVVGGKTGQQLLHPSCSQVDLLIGTPGAMRKYVRSGLYHLQNVSITVIDEADTLTDDSFIDEMTSIINGIPQCQMTLVSATLPRSLPPILQPYDAQFTHVTSPLLHKVLCNITQHFYRLGPDQKSDKLLSLVKANSNKKLIFVKDNSTCFWVSKYLETWNVDCVRLSGDMKCEQRIKEWNKFLQEDTPVLVATDVGSRGLDTTEISHVINYDFPCYAADYVHRIGRTGRMGSPNFCKVTNLISSLREVHLVQKIENAIRTNQEVPDIDGNIVRLVQKKINKKMYQKPI